MDGEALAYLPHGCSCCGGQLAYVQDWEPRRLYTRGGWMQSPPSRMQGGDDPDAVIVLSSCFFFSPFRHSLTRPLPRRFRVTGPSGKGESAADGRRWLWRGASSSFIKYALAGHRCLQGCLRTRGPMQMAAPRARLPRLFRPGTTLALAGPLPCRQEVRPDDPHMFRGMRAAGPLRNC